MAPLTRILSPAGWAWVTALALIVLAVVVTLFDLRQAPRAPSRLIPAARVVDPLRAALLRCQGLGQAGASDPACLAAWAESRRRFLSGGPRS